MKKSLIVVLVGVVVLLFALGMIKDSIIKGSAEKLVEVMTGLKLHMDGFRAGILTQVIDIKGLTLSNPPNFKEPIMVNIPEIFASFDLGALLKNEAHLKEIRLDLKEFVVEKNSKGELNLNSLKVVSDQKSKKRGAAPRTVSAGAKKEAKSMAIKIDKLKLKIGKVVYKDYSSGQPTTKEFNINIDETYTDIKDPAVLASLIVTKALMNTSIANLANFDISSLKGALPADLSGQMASAQKAALKSVDAAQGALSKATAALGTTSAGTSTQEAVKKSTETIKNVLGGLNLGGDESK